ncbi:MAG: lysoplasmalogenase [Saprospiraceae bacterium]|nr:lysoplasmalogenase [Saprospiraceae bacterium]
MASLIGFYISVERRQSNAFILAMIFALFGDVFLLFTSEVFFLLGLCCFLGMQILYAFIFSKESSHNTKQLMFSILVAGIAGTLLITYIWPGLGDLKIAVLVYCFAISSMIVTALNRKKSQRGYYNVAIGVMLFLISDALLAITKFKTPFNGADYIIMATYMLGQFLIVSGMIEAHSDQS